MSQPGRVLGPFVVEREVGRGGMGIVLLARQTSLDRPAVLKKLRRDLADHPHLGERFEREARAAAAVHHQNVVAVYDCFRHRGDRYIAQEFVDGADLKSALAKTGAIPWRVAATIALEAARGLEEIHGQGTVHRDFKPANLLLGRRGEVKIADFGIALEASGEALTQPGVVIGSPPYMPPEQMRGDRLDARGDLFAFGSVVYEMLTGRPPYVPALEEETGSLLARMQRERYPRVRSLAPRTPRALARLIRGCLRAKPGSRITSTSRVRRQLEALLGRPSPADCRAELASWGWERDVFEAREDETVVRVAAPSVEAVGWRHRGLAAGLATLTLAGSILWIDVRPIPDELTVPEPGEAPESLVSIPVERETRVISEPELTRVAPDEKTESNLADASMQPAPERNTSR